MAFNKKKIYKQAVSLIAEKECLDIAELIVFLPCSKQTFYSFFPKDSDELDLFKELINENKIKACGFMKRKWMKSENPTLQVAAYKLMGKTHEVHRLNGTKQETTIKGDKDHPIEFNDEVSRNKLIAELTKELAGELQQETK